MSVKETLMNKSVNKHKTLIREFVAEFMGTFTLLVSKTYIYVFLIS